MLGAWTCRPGTVRSRRVVAEEGLTSDADLCRQSNESSSRNLQVSKDLQELIPEPLRDLVEVVPRGVPKSAVTGGLLLGALGGALITMIVPAWIVAAVPAALFVAQRIWVRRSDRDFERRMAELGAHDLRWDGDGDV